MRLLATTAAALCLAATGALADAHGACAAGKTLEEGVLTIATGNPPSTPGS
jgi:polar amino acid transport system substrate-binding protein